MVTNPLLGIEFIKVINTKILVRFVIAQHEINGNQEAVLNGTDGALFSTPSRQTMVLGFEIAVFGAYCRMRHLGEHRVEVTVGGGRLAATPFAGAFMVTGTAPRPRGKVFMRRESTHIDPGFRQQCSRPTLSNPHDGIKLLYRGTKRRGR
jgi:hypothetical protein